MKKLLVLIAMLIVLATSVLANGVAYHITVTPNDVAMGTTDSKNVVVCLFDQSNNPQTNENIIVDQVCKDLDNDGLCLSSGENVAPSTFSVNPMSTKTGNDGCATLELITNEASNGDVYSYTVNGKENAVEVGTAYVPEFTTIGAALALIGAGFVAYRKRK